MGIKDLHRRVCPKKRKAESRKEKLGLEVTNWTNLGRMVGSKSKGYC